VKHVAPHRWADAFAGKLDDAERADMEAHAAGCRACARARDRIKLASGSFPALRAIQPPEIAWDHVRARVHWSVSTERRGLRAIPRRGRPWVWFAVTVGAGAAVAALATGGFDRPAPAPVAPVAETTHAASMPVAKLPVLTGLVSRSSGDVSIDGLRIDPFDRAIAPNDSLSTGNGRIDVQFGDASAFSLGPGSTLELRRFDAQAIELALTAGSVDIEVSARGPDQRFVVIAGDRTIVVRGTQFRVVHDDAKGTTVACKHGRVDVSDASGKVEVVTGHAVVIKGHDAVATTAVAALSADELAAMAPPITLPVWNSDLANSSAPLEVATSGTRDVRVDGIEIGLAPLRVRVMAGRHTVEAADGAGRFRAAGWIDVSAKPARLDVPSEVSPTGDIAARKRQLLAGIDRTRLTSCTRRIAKQGLSSGTYVQFAISVDRAGAVGFLNVIGSDLPSSVQDCVKNVLQDVRFTTGPSATWRDRIDL
jgi:ferric-dicitrate binding protein FerR (iron transport regulator)